MSIQMSTTRVRALKTLLAIGVFLAYLIASTLYWVDGPSKPSTPTNVPVSSKAINPYDYPIGWVCWHLYKIDAGGNHRRNKIVCADKDNNLIYLTIPEKA